MIFQEPPENFNPKMEVSTCYIALDDTFLFVKASSLKGGLWEIPGGKLEKGESAQEAAVREIKEETGIDLLNLLHFKTVYIRFPEMDFTYHMFQSTLKDVPLVALNQREHTEYRWITLEEALTLPLIQGEKECIYLFMK